jgi:hypothetical protein
MMPLCRHVMQHITFAYSHSVVPGNLLQIFFSAILEPKWAKMVIFGSRFFYFGQTAGRWMTPLCRHLMQHITFAYSHSVVPENLLQIFFWPF